MAAANVKHADLVLIRAVGRILSGSAAACLGPWRRPMACCGQFGADRFEAGEIEDRRAARAAPICNRDRDPAPVPGPDDLGGVLWKDGRPPILGEQPTEVSGFLAISLHCNIDIARA